MSKRAERDFLQQHSKTKVLDEDSWMESMEKIIKRDFFPDMNLMTAQIQLFEAIHTKDPQLIEMAQKKVDEITQKQTIDSKNVRKVSLDEFVTNYTSEDNASFEVILQKMKESHRETWRKFFHESKVGTSASDIKLLTNGSENTKLMIEGSKPIQKNTLFFAPDTESKRQVVVSHLPDKKIVYENIKYVEPEIEKTFQKKKEDLWAQDVLHDEIVEGSETPVINGYKMIRQPTIKDLQDESLRLMSWGSVIETNVLDGPSFRIPETPKREQLGDELANKMKKKNSTTLSVGSIKSPVQRIQSPAQILLHSKKRSHDSFAQSLKASYSPITSPRTTPKTVPSSSPVKKVKKEDITEGLLKL